MRLVAFARYWLFEQAWSRVAARRFGYRLIGYSVRSAVGSINRVENVKESGGRDVVD